MPVEVVVRKVEVGSAGALAAGRVAHRPGIEVSGGGVVVGSAKNGEQGKDDSHDESAHVSPLSFWFGSVAGGLIIVL